jgi:hypothetical protein
MSLVYDPRLYDLMRQGAITSVDEALVELITNSHDAYTSVERTTGGNNFISLPITVNTDLVSRQIIVKDSAKGMTSQEMRDKILTVGSLTADEFTRGLIGRGSKDISNIGNLEFTAIKDNKISVCVIRESLTGEIIVSDRDVTQEERRDYDIIGNGMSVKVSLSNMVTLPNNEELYRRMKNNYFLRNLYIQSTHPIILNDNRLTYEFPKGEEVVKLDFIVPGYPQAKASLVLYKAKEIIPNPITDLELRYGVMVSSNQATYECGGLFASNSLYTSDYRWNPNLKLVYGELKCDYIDKLAREISTIGRTIENPFLVFDPNRRNGLHKKHPFTIALYEIPYRWLEILLNKLQDERDEFLITGDDISQMLSSVEQLLQENLPLESTLYTWRSKSDQKNLNAMVGHITNLSINQNIVNIDHGIIDQLITGKDLLPISTLQNTKFKFDIKISDSKTMTKPFEVYYYSDKISIRINIRDESVQPFVTLKDDGSLDIQSEAGLLSVNRILHDAVIYMMTRQTLMSSSTPTVSDTNNYNEISDIQNVAKQQLKSYMQGIYQSIYKKYH